MNKIAIAALLINTAILGMAQPDSPTIHGEEKINCDELARHILEKMDEVYPHAFVSLRDTKGSLRMMQHGEGRKNARHFKSSDCAYSYNYGTDLANDSDFNQLSNSNELLLKYQEALKRCLKNSTTPSSLATQTINGLQQQMMRNAQCKALRDQSIGDERKKQAAALAEKEKARKHKQALDEYINDLEK